MLDDTSSQSDSGIDAVQLAALRKCDDVCFFHRAGKSYIRAIKRNPASERDPFATEVVVDIPAATHWHDYAKDRAISYPIPSFDGFEMVGNYSDSTWRTTAGALRKGDVLILEWSKDAGSPAVNDTGLHVDTLHLIVTRGCRAERGNNKSQERLRFLIDYAITPNNSARMIKNVRPAVEYSL